MSFFYIISYNCRKKERKIRDVEKLLQWAVKASSLFEIIVAVAV
jgi:hypothetical protein